MRRLSLALVPVALSMLACGGDFFKSPGTRI